MHIDKATSAWTFYNTCLVDVEAVFLPRLKIVNKYHTQNFEVPVLGILIS
jgi:hypothetical protein